MVIYVYDFDHLPLYMIKVHVLILQPMHRYLQAKVPYVSITNEIMPKKFIHLLPWRICIAQYSSEQPFLIPYQSDI